MVYACLGVTCHLHFWHSDQGLQRATAVTQWVERTPNKESVLKVDSGEEILLPLLPRFELATFQLQVRCSNQQAVPAPRHSVGTYQEMSSHITCQGTLGHSCLSSLKNCGLILA